MIIFSLIILIWFFLSGTAKSQIKKCKQIIRKNSVIERRKKDGKNL